MRKIIGIYFALILVSLITSNCSKERVYDYTKLNSYTPELEAGFLEKQKLKLPYAVSFNA